MSVPHERSGCVKRQISCIERQISHGQSSSKKFIDCVRDCDLHPIAQTQFAVGSKEDWHEFVLPHSTVFPETIYPLVFALKSKSGTRIWSLKNRLELQELGNSLQYIVRPESTTKELLGHAGKNYVNSLSAIWGLTDASRVSSHSLNTDRCRLNNTLMAEGIHRLQHACLLFKTNQYSILIDPQFSFGAKAGEDWPLIRELGKIDAVILSHSHGDHFCRASLLMFDRNTLFIIPKNYVISMLSPDIFGFLQDAGFHNVIQLADGDSVRCGEFVIDAHPFYGEQPWLTCAESRKGFRNSGMTISISFKGVKSLILIDSGQEYANSMTDYISATRERLGRIDFVFSNMRTFDWMPGSIDSTGRFLLCYPERTILDHQRWPYGQSMTLGIDGLSKLLNILDETTFYPYAHWWKEPGKAIYLESDSMYEEELVGRLSENVSKGIACKNWRIGDYIRV